MILLDARKWTDYGIGSFVRHLYPGLLEALPAPIGLLADPDNLPPFAGSCTLYPCPWRNGSAMEQMRLPALLRRISPRLFYAPHYVLPWVLNVPCAVTVHDAIHMLFPHLYPPRVKTWLAERLMRRVLRRSRLVLTDSETTRSDLQRLFGHDPQAVQVVPIGLSPSILHAPKERIPLLDEPYLLTVGSRQPHKNVYRLWEALALLHRQGLGITLVMPGFLPSPEELDQLAHLDLSHRVFFPGKVSETELLTWMDHAHLLVHPSLYEGFGLPPLEALARGVPILVSRAGSLPEVLGVHGRYFDPCSSEDMAAQMALALEGRLWSAEDLAEARAFAHAHTWDACVATYAQVLMSVSG